MQSSIKKLQKQLKRINQDIEKERKESRSDDENTILNELLDKRSLIERQIQELSLSNPENGAEYGCKNIKKKRKYKLRQGSNITTIMISDNNYTATITKQNECISPKSPLALALNGKRVGDLINVTTPLGTVDYEIMAII